MSYELNMPARSSGIARGRYGNAYLQKRYLAALGEFPSSSRSDSDEALTAYYLYLCKRKLRLVYLSSAYGLRGIEAYAGYAAGVIFRLMGQGFSRQEGAPGIPRARASCSHENVFSEPMAGFTCGRSGRDRLASESVLGTAAAAKVPVLDLTLVIHLAEWELLMASASVLVDLMTALDLAVPLNMNFRVYLALYSKDRTSRIEGVCGPDEFEAPSSLLGVSLALGDR
jgi:hypothetical protein